MPETFTTIDKTAWGDGPWQDEPDEIAWSYGDVPCRIVRHPRHGQLNGYVGLPLSHPWADSGYDDIDVDVHGGLTFSGQFDRLTFATRTPEALWWIGFDCHHLGDLAPGFVALEELHGLNLPSLHQGTYRDVAYVTAEVERLAAQAIAALRR